jgi:hypothetical protein
MDVTVKSKKEVTHVFADFGVRYWEDGEVNGEQDDETSPNMPLVQGSRWKIIVDLATGQIDGWPKDVAASVHYKVCDDGIYKLLDQSGNVVVQKSEYVPSMFSPKDDGYGDYVIMDILPTGVIDGWQADLSYFEPEEY